MNIYLSGLLWMLGAAVVGGGTAYLVRRFGHDEGRLDNNDAAGQVFTIISGLHAVLVAFVLISLFDAVHAARDGLRHEADSVIAAVWAADSLPSSASEQVRAISASYLETVIQREWPQIRAGDEVTGPGWTQLQQLHRTINKAPIQTDDEYYATQKTEAVRQVLATYQAREERITRLVHGDVGTVVWFALVLGGVIATLLPNLFGGTKMMTHVVIVSTLAGTIALLLFAIHQLQNPFGGAARVEPEAFESALERLRQAP
ncbi:DUF4239 domain-containing protein [Amycolatopsis cihanbeyliensis]|uniref:Uncharacterized protein DUF4239 n=1 Tax=Amycolatopsis cihanbeyliensis TaxID=1128664 RepID=A0A542DCV2_AMYCI|nr:DUF4239 domain-containing protein [Amycolatopsis cihanbeyliensis]TQJ00898.1 uncharacterized protein DUF4239 [Amycolatopsis cihanbeyliensis]